VKHDEDFTGCGFDVLGGGVSSYSIVYRDELVDGILGEVIRLEDQRIIHFRVPFCLEEDEELGCVHFLPQAFDVAYHEMGHIILWAAGIPTPEHHTLMNDGRLCPGKCEQSVMQNH
jgi:hypothetical protein